MRSRLERLVPISFSLRRNSSTSSSSFPDFANELCLALRVTIPKNDFQEGRIAYPCPPGHMYDVAVKKASAC
jgi:hypothetical protein